MKGTQEQDPVTGEKRCHWYNQASGCRNGDQCMFSHICSVPGCGAPHPRTEHH